ncbi:MAG: hypothetical protein ABFR47_10055, partial [Verrucomicrobiota bacterium]
VIPSLPRDLLTKVPRSGSTLKQIENRKSKIINMEELVGCALHNSDLKAKSNVPFCHFDRSAAKWRKLADNWLTFPFETRFPYGALRFAPCLRCAMRRIAPVEMTKWDMVFHVKNKLKIVNRKS